MSRFVDSGAVHVPPQPVQARRTPEQDPRDEFSTGGVATGVVSNWLEDVAAADGEPGLQVGLRRRLQDPQQLYSRASRRSPGSTRTSPRSSTLPNKTNGYQRKAQAHDRRDRAGGGRRQLGGVGPRGRQRHHCRVRRPARRGPPARASRSPARRSACCSPRTPPARSPSTAAQVAAALETQSQGLIDRAHPYRTNAGTGIVQPTAGPVALTDFLDQKRAGAPAGEVPRGPSRSAPADRQAPRRHQARRADPGQDHAREWVPITITLETAERLVRNYATDPETKKIVDNTDIFLIPSNNPDGANYSFYNFASQRRNMTNHCPDANADPARRNAWGVDLNRNYRVGVGLRRLRRRVDELHQRHLPGPGGAVRARVARTSSGSSRTYRNIKFMMSVHSNGGQLFWQPGAYIADGRITTPRPPLGTRRSTGSRPAGSSRRSRRSGRPSSRRRTSAARRDVLYSSRRQRARGAVLQLRVYAFGWEVGGSVYNTGHRQLAGRLVPAGVGRRPERRQRPQRDDGVRQRHHGDVPDRRRLGQGQEARRPRARARRGATRARRSTCASRPASRPPSTTRPTAPRRRSSRRATRRPSSASRGRPVRVDRDHDVPLVLGRRRGQHRARSRTRDGRDRRDGGAGGTVPATLSLTLGAPATFGAFTPGVAKDYTASTTANVISTAGDAALTRLAIPAT